MVLQKSSELYVHIGSKSNITQVYLCVPVDDSAISQKRTAWVSCSCWRHRKQLTLAETEDSHNGRYFIGITQPFYDSWVWHVWCLSVYCKHEFVFSSPFFISWLHSMLIRLKKSRNIKNFSAVCMDHMWFVNCDIDCRVSVVLNKIGAKGQKEQAQFLKIV